MIKLQGMGSGACCVTALVDGNQLVVSNLGDCRAVLCRNGMAEALTSDHTPTREDERRRIEDKVILFQYQMLSFFICKTQSRGC